jgi:hypothetical protein
MKYRDNLSKIINKYTPKHKYNFGSTSPLLTRHLNGIQKEDYTIIAGASSSGKRSFTDFYYVILVLKQWFSLEDEERATRPLKILYFSSRENKELKLLKWTATIYTSMYKEIIDLPTILQGPGKLCPMDNDLYNNIDMAASIIDEAINEGVLEIIDGKLSIFDLESHIDTTLESFGTLTHTMDGSVFKPNEDKENTLFITVIDDLNNVQSGAASASNTESSKTLDKFFKEYSSLGINMVGIKSIVPFNQTLYEPSFKDIGDLSPNKAIVMFNPLLSQKKRYAGFTTSFFIGETDLIERLRFAVIIKNNTGISNTKIPLLIIAESGNFMELKFPTRNNNGEDEETYFESTDSQDIYNIKRLKIIKYMRNKIILRNK